MKNKIRVNKTAKEKNKSNDGMKELKRRLKSIEHKKPNQYITKKETLKDYIENLLYADNSAFGNKFKFINWSDLKEYIEKHNDEEFSIIVENKKENDCILALYCLFLNNYFEIENNVEDNIYPIQITFTKDKMIIDRGIKTYEKAILFKNIIFDETNHVVFNKYKFMNNMIAIKIEDTFSDNETINTISRKLNLRSEIYDFEGEFIYYIDEYSSIIKTDTIQEGCKVYTLDQLIFNEIELYSFRFHILYNLEDTLLRSTLKSQKPILVHSLSNIYLMNAFLSYSGRNYYIDKIKENMIYKYDKETKSIDILTNTSQYDDFENDILKGKNIKLFDLEQDINDVKQAFVSNNDLSETLNNIIERTNVEEEIIEENNTCDNKDEIKITVKDLDAQPLIERVPDILNDETNEEENEEIEYFDKIDDDSLVKSIISIEGILYQIIDAYNALNLSTMEIKYFGSDYRFNYLKYADYIIEGKKKKKIKLYNLYKIRVNPYESKDGTKIIYTLDNYDIVTLL